MEAELAALVDALERRTRGETGRRFENIVSPAMAGAFVKAWLALGRDPIDIPSEWRDMADTLLDI
jgi:hypothetical protein